MDIVTAIKIWTLVKPVRRIRAFRNKRRAKKGLPLIEVDYQEDLDMLEGKKTYIGIATTLVGLLLGWLGIGGAEDAQSLVDAVVQSIDTVLQAGGLLIATYGRWKAKPSA